MPNLPWNEDDSDGGAWGDFLAGLVLGAIGVALFLAGLSGHGGSDREGAPIEPSVVLFGGVAFLSLGAVLVIKGYGFSYSDWRARRRARQRRQGRGYTRRR